MRLRPHRCDYTPPMVTSGPTHHLHPLDAFHTAHTLFCSTTNEKISLINIKYVICGNKKANIWWTFILYKTFAFLNIFYLSSQKRLCFLSLYLCSDFPPRISCAYPFFDGAGLTDGALGCWDTTGDAAIPFTHAPKLTAHFLNTHTHKPLNKTPDNVGKTDIKKHSRG